MLNRRASKKHHSNSPTLIIFTAIAFIFGIGVGYLIWGESSGSNNAAVKRVDVSVDDDPSEGPANAPITIIEFSDFQCPYCQLWHQTVYQQLMAAYPNQIRFVYRDFPLPSHPEAEPAAEAADCAGDQGAYWAYHNALFEATVGLGRQAYEQYASEIGLNLDTFKACLDSHKFKAEVQGDVLDASRAGVNSTPYFFINGRPLVGALPLADFVSVIDQELDSSK